MAKDVTEKFEARLLLSEVAIVSAEVWVSGELWQPVDGGRSSSEWIHESLYCEARESFPPGNVHVFIRGTIEGAWDYWGEYDETLEFDIVAQREWSGDAESITT